MQSADLSADLGALIENLSVGVVKIDDEGVVSYANATAERMLGALRSDLVGRTAARFLREPGEFEIDGCWIRAEITSLEQGYRLVQLHDISMRKQSDMALETTQEFLQAVLDSVDTGIVACDSKGTLKLFNRAARTFHGIGEQPIPPEQWAARYDLYDPDGVTPLRKEDIPLYRAYSGETVRRQEIVIAPPEGRRRTVLGSGRALRGKDGRLLGAVVAMSDISHRRASRKRLRHYVRQLRDLFNYAPIAYHEIDMEGRIRRVNVAELRLLERTRDEMIGAPVWEFVSEQEREKSRKAVLEKLAGGRSLRKFVREYITPSGRRLLIEVHETLIQDRSGLITGIRSALLDVTSRLHEEIHTQALIQEKTAREQAETDSAEIRSILERIGDAFMAFDTEWRYTYVNHRAAELALKPASELIGKCVWEEFPEAVQTAFYTELHRAMREQVPIDFDNYFEPLGKWFQNSVYPSPSGVGVFYRDITERVRTENALKTRTSELARKNSELETFASVVSHDLQEPLRMVASYASLVSKKYGESLEPDAQEFLSYINTGVSRMQRLIKDLLALSKLDRLQDEIGEVSMMHVVEMVCGNLDLMIEDNGATIIRRDLPIVRFNETQLMQVLQNLVANSIRYRRDDRPHIVISAEQYERGWMISVTDNGIGFDMQFAEQVFRPFRRLHRREDGGSGIGLAICQKIIHGRGGRIWAESQPGSGSTFHFTIPDAIPRSE